MDVLTASRTEQILSRYRPIAPKPQFFAPNAPSDRPLNNLPPLPPPPPPPPAAAAQRPCKSRKRSRAGASFSPQKKGKCVVNAQIGDLAFAPSTQLGLSLPGFNGFRPECRGDLVTLPLLPCADETDPPKRNDADPAERGNGASAKTTVIVPQPVRAVGSSISVGRISEAKPRSESPPVSKKPEEVEREVESEELPSVVSDSNNRVRLANSAYKEMVGQPECLWLDSVAASRRLSGEVMLDLSETSVPVSSNGFSCRVRIEWASNGRKIFVDAACDVIRLSCESKDYRYTWRFHTREAF
ncbi:hypothetical protein H6P81_020727 [Aristolochia fimbriata]|uniref:DUF7950 domain-containing protein n=1 Tax=Aristolochia fimbriata TaxID=158543 RepID=A0AAV7DZP9_ARIFI|nr:hypothetical protein H6P81_020727 [Aristolochia fimbriata]